MFSDRVLIPHIFICHTRLFHVYSGKLAGTGPEAGAQCIFPIFLSSHTTFQQTFSCFIYLSYKYDSVAAWGAERQRFKVQRLSGAIQRRQRRERGRIDGAENVFTLQGSHETKPASTPRQRLLRQVNLQYSEWKRTTNILVQSSTLHCCINKMSERP